MITTQRQTKAATIQRTIHVTPYPEPGCLVGVVLEVATKKRTSTVDNRSYFLRKISSDFGEAVQIEQDDSAETYHVHTDRGQTTCDCPGGIYRGSCRHIQMVQEAHKLGLL